MSHYAVALFANDPNDFDNLMAPFDETDENFFIFEPVSDEEMLNQWEKFKKQNPAWLYSDWLKATYTLRDNTYGNWYNPHGYYDYYVIDGKDYMYDLLPEAEQRFEKDGWPEFYHKSDLDWFSGSDEHPGSYWRKQWRVYSKDGDGFFSEKYYLERYVTEEQYVKEMMRPAVPYAFVTPDGKWHAPGRVGWFALSDETAESQDAYWEEWCDFIINAPDCYVSILDCHI